MIMTWIRLRLNLTVTVCAVVCIIGGTFAPTIALACEGGAEEQTLSIKPIKEGGKCEEEAGRVAFKALTETCEYRVENENATEKVEVTKRELGFEEQCKGILTNCLSYVTPANPGECKVGTTLTVLGVCYVKLEYTKKPATPPSLASLEMKTKAVGGGVSTRVVGQKLS